MFKRPYYNIMGVGIRLGLEGFDRTQLYFEIYFRIVTTKSACLDDRGGVCN